MNYLTGFVADAPGARQDPADCLARRDLCNFFHTRRLIAVEDVVAGVPVPNDRSVDRSK